MAMQGTKMTTPSAEEPVVAGSSSVPVGDGGVVDPPPSSEGDEERSNEGAVLGGDEVDDHLRDEDFSSSDDDDNDDDDDGDTTDNEDVDSDSEFEDDDDNDQVPVVNKSAAVAAPGTFLRQPALIATVQSTVSFTKIRCPWSTTVRSCQGGGGGSEIVVVYRYTRFLRAQSGGDGVDMHVLGPKQGRLRFFVAPSSSSSATSESDPVSALRFAGAALAPLVYPARFSAQLRALWSATTRRWGPRVVLPPRSWRLLVTVDAGILRPADFTPARMRRMRAAMESMARELVAVPMPPVDDVGTEVRLRLPALLGSEDDVRPTNRRRVTGEDDCPICCELLEEGLAAWPKCSHIFHAGCLEQHLLRGHLECPLCRSELKLSLAPRRK